MTTYRRVLITGHRRWPMPSIIYQTLGDLLVIHGALVIIQGANGNTDFTAYEWALRMKKKGLLVTPESYPPKWRFYGWEAGFIRNQQMVDSGVDECQAFLGPCQKANCRKKRPHYSHGTIDCIERAEGAGIPVTRHEWPR